MTRRSAEVPAGLERELPGHGLRELTLVEETAVADQHSATLGANEVTTAWTDCSDRAIDIPDFRGRVVDDSTNTRRYVTNQVGI